ncbi:ubiquitin hydrolase, putative [Trypanosoma cruzi]|uniref:Ubiquitin carboxyl-terminal hydrolase n=2 Tax=Trypanosoma cruzi TaxID=5693 RepID=Q4DTJ5_TRYCC|nr:ubiquitin hydrolase, putative [Trypanosoma cruzi]EAN95845.1 ubiquitin hydrolase, putative [Trypanosoma cruzi]|eukprot:XP_817696.1 ubiquitin hydrolase [Trypanosoma cruzi strain CL Brener]
MMLYESNDELADDMEEKLPYVGLVNQGSTCYLNSVIQALFHLPSFRQTLYFMAHPERDPIILALRNIFSQLHCATPLVSTKELTDAFGWGANDAWVQHDVHEMMQKLFDRLETICKGTPQENFIRDLFYGELTYITRAVDGVDYISYRNEGFYDVELLVKNMDTIYESFELWAKPERIEGVSLEITKGGPCTSHTVERSQRFVRLPPVLLIHPNRAEFSMETFTVRTLPGKWTFPTSLNLEPYVLPMELEKNGGTGLSPFYELRSIVVHQGIAENGHYFAYVRFGDQWVCFNDMYVFRVSEEAVMTSASCSSDTESLNKGSNERASLLVYVNTSVSKDILTEDFVPTHIKAVAEEILAERERIQRERCETVTFRYITERESLVEALDDPYDPPVNVKSTSVPTFFSIEEVHAAIAEDIGQSPDRIRVWMYDGGIAADVFEAHLHNDTNRREILFVEILPDKKEKFSQMSVENAFFALVRIIHEDSLGPCKIIHTRKDLERLIGESEEENKCLICLQGPSLWEVSVDRVLVGGNVILCPVSMKKEHALELLRQRKFKEVEVLLLDRRGTGMWTPTGTIRLDAKSSYVDAQKKVYEHLVAAHHSPPISPEYIGFHCAGSHARNPSIAVFPPSFLGSMKEGMVSLLWHGEDTMELFVTLLPAPLSSIDTLRVVLLNVGGGIRPAVHVEGRSYKLGELFRLAMQQTSSCLPTDLFNYIMYRLQKRIPVLRLIMIPNEKNQRVFENEDDEVLECIGLYVMDVLAEIRKGFFRVDVVFYDRRSGEGRFGFPTNIALTESYKETGMEIAQRVAEKIKATVSVEEIGRWIVAVKGKSGVIRTVGPKEVLKSIMKDLNEELECLMIDRPRSLLIDGVDDVRQGIEHSIIIKDPSLQDSRSKSAQHGEM